MGGAFNLWIGISFITLIELTELLYNVMAVAIGGGKKPADKTQQPTECDQTRYTLSIFKGTK